MALTPIHGLAAGLRVRADRLDAVGRRIHRVLDRAAKVPGGQRDTRSDDGQDQSIFSRRRTTLVGPQAFQKGHIFYPYSLGAIHSCSCSARSEGTTSELPSLMRISFAVFCLKK